MGRKSKFSEAEMIAAAREMDRGARPTDVARKFGVSLQTMARWRERYSASANTNGSGASASQLGHLEDENVRLRNLVAQFALEIEALRSELSAYRSAPAPTHGSGMVGIVGRLRRVASRPSA